MIDIIWEFINHQARMLKEKIVCELCNEVTNLILISLFPWLPIIKLPLKYQLAIWELKNISMLYVLYIMCPQFLVIVYMPDIYIHKYNVSIVLPSQKCPNAIMLSHSVSPLLSTSIFEFYTCASKCKYYLKCTQSNFC